MPRTFLEEAKEVRELLLAARAKNPSPALDSAISKFETLELNAKNQLKQLERVLEMITAMAALDFSGTIALSDHESEMDAVATGLNMLSEELREAVVSKESYLSQKNLLESVLNASPSVIFIKDVNGRYLYCNKRYGEAMRKAPQEIVGKTLFDLFPQKTAELMSRFDNEVLSSGQSKMIEETIPSLEGPRWNLVSLFPIRDSKNQVCALGGIATDIDEAKKTKLALDRERLFAKQILHSTPNSILLVRAMDASVFYASDSSELLIGYKPEELIGLNTAFFEQMVHPDDWNKSMHVRREEFVNHGFSSDKGVFRVKHKNGSWRVMRRTTVVFERDEQGNTLSFMVSLEDITTESQTNLELEQTLAAINESALMAATDLSGKIIYANQKFCEVSGYSLDELLGQNHRIVNSGYHSQEYFSTMWKTIGEGRVWKGEIRNKAKNGTFYWVQAMITPIKDLSGKTFKYLAIRFDVTREKETQRSLISASKMASLGEMAAGIAHEINNPLTIISGKVGLIKRQAAQGALDPLKTQEALGKIEATVERIAKIIRGLRTFSRNAEFDVMESTPVARIVDDTLELCRERFRTHGIDLRVHCGLDLRVECRPSQISQILMNLLGNSFDALESLSEKWVALEVVGKGANVLFSVTDSGGGIRPEIVEKIMQPFYTTKEVGKGTGLGLSISRGIAEAHHGELHYVPLSKNTRFELELPVSQPVDVPHNKKTS